MFKHLIAFTVVLLCVSVLPGKAQNLTPNDTISKEVVIVDGQQLNEKQLQRYYRQLRKDVYKRQVQNKNFDRQYTEFGGWKGLSHGGFLPTGETASFILAGEDVEKRLSLIHISVYHPDS